MNLQEAIELLKCEAGAACMENPSGEIYPAAERFLQAVNIVTKAATATNWTPCAEGLPTPEDGQFVNVTYEYGGELRSSSATYHKLSGNYYGCDKYGSMMMGVLAWQPLPQPWTGDHIVDVNKKISEPWTDEKKGENE